MVTDNGVILYGSMCPRSRKIRNGLKEGDIHTDIMTCIHLYPFCVWEYIQGTHFIARGATLSRSGSNKCTKQTQPKTFSATWNNSALGSNIWEGICFLITEDGTQLIR